MKPKNTTLRAYEVFDKLGEMRDIVFALTAKAAKGKYSPIWDYCDEWTDRRSKRAPAFDDATRPTPLVSEYFARGYTWQCHNCEHFIYDDEPDRIVDDKRGAAWCNQDCKSKQP